MRTINGMFFTAQKRGQEYRGVYGVKGIWRRTSPIRRLDRYAAMNDARAEVLDILAMARYGGHRVEDMGHDIA